MRIYMHVPLCNYVPYFHHVVLLVRQEYDVGPPAAHSLGLLEFIPVVNFFLKFVRFHRVSVRSDVSHA